jgi:hypothetical protein
MTIFTAKGQRGKEAEGIHFSLPLRTFASSHLCLFAPLPLCSKKFHHQVDQSQSHKGRNVHSSFVALWLCDFVVKILGLLKC